MSKKQTGGIQKIIFSYFFIFIIILIIILDAFFIYQMRHIVQKDSHTYAYEIVKQVGRSVDYYISHMEDIAVILKRDDEIKNYLLKDKKIYSDMVYIHKEEKLICQPFFGQLFSEQYI